ncbi:MAG: hypothetical protein A3A72_00200 [Deltaproteobacteria bacterium RIFCSPLOWO2_01_FULL_38_9]|nr:MAG: hypothetical protein A3A72_00200 [Deltaproteobacteria bacterium RIFCSPLOWO2_01_FULL_38_9]
MTMDEKLYEQATKAVLQRQKNELAEEIKDEYHLLNFESEKVEMDAPTRKRVKLLQAKCSKLSPIQIYDLQRISSQAEILKNYLKTGRYHQNELEELGLFVKRRREL